MLTVRACGPGGEAFPVGAGRVLTYLRSVYDCKKESSSPVMRAAQVTHLAPIQRTGSFRAALRTASKKLLAIHGFIGAPSHELKVLS